jgi:hypothetical protein
MAKRPTTLWHVLLKNPSEPLKVVVLRVEDGKEKEALARALGAEEVLFFPAWNGLFAAYGAGPSSTGKTPNVVHGHQVVQGPILLLNTGRGEAGVPYTRGWTLDEAALLAAELNKNFRLDKRGVPSTGWRPEGSPGIHQEPTFRVVMKKVGQRAVVLEAPTLSKALEQAGLKWPTRMSLMGPFVFYDDEAGPLHADLPSEDLHLHGTIVAAKTARSMVPSQRTVVPLTPQRAKMMATFLDGLAANLPRLLKERCLWESRSLPEKIANDPATPPSVVGVLKEVGKPSTIVRVPAQNLGAYIEKTVGPADKVWIRIYGRLMILGVYRHIDNRGNVEPSTRKWFNFAIRTRAGIVYVAQGTTLVFQAALDPAGYESLHTLEDLRSLREIGSLSRDRAVAVSDWLDQLAKNAPKDAHAVARIEKEIVRRTRESQK